MALEISITASLAATKGNVSANLAAGTLKFDWTGKNYVRHTQTVPTTAGGTAMVVTGLGSLGFYLIKNNDPTNFVTLLNAVAGTATTQIPKNGCVLGIFASTVTAPALLADTASCDVEYLILEP